MGPVGRVPPTFEQAGTAVDASPNSRTYWDGPLQLLKIVRQTRAQNALHLVSNAQNCVGFWGSALDPDGGGDLQVTTLPIPPLVDRNFLPSAIFPLCTINASRPILQGSLESRGTCGMSSIGSPIRSALPTASLHWSDAA